MFVSDLARSRAYYSALLGAEPVREHEGMLASFNVGDTELRLHSDTHATWLPTGVKKGVGAALHLRVADLDAQWKRLESLGVDLPEPPTTLHTGIRKVAMKDPDGYEIELVELPAG